jgi:hypothetical protein
MRKRSSEKVPVRLNRVLHARDAEQNSDGEVDTVGAEGYGQELFEEGYAERYWVSTTILRASQLCDPEKHGMIQFTWYTSPPA